MILKSVAKSLNDLVHLLHQLSDSQYSEKCDKVEASIGEHSRHLIEMYQCLVNGYEPALINYDNRQRDIKMQNDRKIAIDSIRLLINDLDKPNKKLSLKQALDNETVEIETNYFRELLYNFEHCIHHQALIRVALLRYTEISVPPHFGVAPSTIEYRAQCAQ